MDARLRLPFVDCQNMIVLVVGLFLIVPQKGRERVGRGRGQTRAHAKWVVIIGTSGRGVSS